MTLSGLATILQRTIVCPSKSVANGDVTGLNKSSGSERESLSKGAGHTDEKVQTGADRDAAAAD